MSHAWAPLSLARVSTLFASARFPWWVAGGYAIELAVGRAFREHEDLDLLILRRDQAAVRSFLGEWDCRPVDTTGLLRVWKTGDILPMDVHEVWCREDTDAPWRFSLMLDEADGDTWYSRAFTHGSRTLSYPLPTMDRAFHRRIFRICSIITGVGDTPPIKVRDSACLSRMAL